MKEWCRSGVRLPDCSHCMSMLSFLPPHCLSQPSSGSSGSLQVCLCWGREAVSACPSSGRRGPGEMGVVRVGVWSCCGVQLSISRSCALHSHCSVCVQTPLCIVLVCNYSKHFKSVLFFFFKCIWCNSHLSNGPTEHGKKIPPSEGARTASACQLLLFTRVACTKIETTVMLYLHAVDLDFLHKPTDSGSC